jgi:glutamine synthetase
LPGARTRDSVRAHVPANTDGQNHLRQEQGMTPEEVLKFAEDNRIEYVDLRFLDFPGRWQHLTAPIADLTLQTFQDGVDFDGHAPRGWQEPNASDMLIIPVAETMVFDPFCQHPTIAMICDVKDPVTRAEHPRDPRSVAHRAEACMRAAGVADTAYFGPELEFFIFDEVCYDQGGRRHHKG